MSDDFEYSRISLHQRAKRLSRIFEILPALLSWGIVLGMLILTVLDPVLSALVVVAFVLSWLLRMMYTNIFLVLSYLRLQAERNTDWLERIRKMEHPEAYLKELEANGKSGCWREKLSLRNHRRELAALIRSGSHHHGAQLVQLA